MLSSFLRRLTTSRSQIRALFACSRSRPSFSRYLECSLSAFLPSSTLLRPSLDVNHSVRSSQTSRHFCESPFAASLGLALMLHARSYWTAFLFVILFLEIEWFRRPSGPLGDIDADNFNDWTKLPPGCVSRTSVRFGIPC